MLIKNKYTLWGGKRLLNCVAKFSLKLLCPQQAYASKEERLLSSSTLTIKYLLKHFHTFYLDELHFKDGHYNTACMFVQFKTGMKNDDPNIY